MDIAVYIKTHKKDGKDNIVCMCMAKHHEHCNHGVCCEHQTVQYNQCQDIGRCFANIGNKNYDDSE